jgi:hypothetical protein
MDRALGRTQRGPGRPLTRGVQCAAPLHQSTPFKKRAQMRKRSTSLRNGPSISRRLSSRFATALYLGYPESPRPKTAKLVPQSESAPSDRRRRNDQKERMLSGASPCPVVEAHMTTSVSDGRFITLYSSMPARTRSGGLQEEKRAGSAIRRGTCRPSPASLTRKHRRFASHAMRSATSCAHPVCEP